MLKKLLSSMLLLVSISAIALAPAYGESNKDQKPPAPKAKEKIIKLGVDAPVTVKLDSGEKLSGRIGELGEDTFVLLAPVKGDRTGRLTNRIVIAYPKVKQVKYLGSTGGANLGPGFLIAGAVILLIKLIR